MEKKIKILVIEDNAILRASIIAQLGLSGFETFEASDGQQGITEYRKSHPDIILTDLKMPVKDGMQVIKEIAADDEEIPIIVISGEGDINDAIKSVRLGAWDYITKPIYEIEILIYAINKALEKVFLIRKNREYQESLENKKKVMESDLKMAINVQKNYFPKKPPVSKKWDIAFENIPMSGVTGDFYDFYEINGELEGLCLFDVSGHGIASALITMLAKSIAFRGFKSKMDQSLNKVLEHINEELISEIDIINYYLTGVMLKFSGETVEYVNAAHPTILHYQSETDSIIQPDNDGKLENGYFLGMSFFKNEYEEYKFEIKKNDCLLLFTDCLIEADNEDGERYSLDRLKTCFKNIPKEKTSSEMINLIINDFNDFRKNGLLNDDLTIILLKKN